MKYEEKRMIELKKLRVLYAEAEKEIKELKELNRHFKRSRDNATIEIKGLKELVINACDCGILEDCEINPNEMPKDIDRAVKQIKQALK